MTRRRLALAIVGLAVGAGAALAALLAFGGKEEAAVTVLTTTSTTTAPAAAWIDADEIALGPTVMVIEGITVEDGEAVLAYDLFDINPVGPGSLLESDSFAGGGLERLAEEAAVAPQLWTLITADGEIPGTTSSPRARTARFALPGGALPEVLGLRLDRYWMRLPYAYRAALPLSATVVLDAGYSLAVGRVIEQTNSRIVQVDLAAPGGYAGSSTDPGMLFLAVRGAGWSFTSGRTSTGLQLVHDPTPLPDPIWFAARSAYWVAFDRPVPIDAGVLRLG
jgi:hypothetical protein